MKLKKLDRILFLGDSITEWGRDKEDDTSLGTGYVSMVAKELRTIYPTYGFQFFNQGISGNKVEDLNNRLQECLDLKPDCLILMVGINDVWHGVGQSNFGTTREQKRFENAYRQLLTKLIGTGITRILVLEPFVLNFPLDRREWRTDLDPKIQIIRQLVDEFSLQLVPIDGLINEQAILGSPRELTGEDGVHPTVLGARFIAQKILERLEVEE